MQNLDFGDWRIYVSEGAYMELTHNCSAYSYTTTTYAVIRGVCEDCLRPVPGDVKAILGMSRNYLTILECGDLVYTRAPARYRARG